MSLASLARSFVITLGFTIAFIAPLHAGPVRYDSGNGLTASADFTIAGTTLSVLLTNTSVAPFGGQNGTANVVLSSLGFDLPPGVSVLSGTVALGPGSTIVTSTPGTGWFPFAGPADLGPQYGFSNTGVGSSGGNVTRNVTHTVTSYTSGDHQVVAFGGGALASNGLEWGLVPSHSSDLGSDRIFVQNSVVLTLRLSAPIADTSFVTTRSYVEFGSDYLYVPADDMTPMPEPAALALVGIGVLMLGATLQKRRRQPA